LRTEAQLRLEMLASDQFEDGGGVTASSLTIRGPLLPFGNERLATFFPEPLDQAALNVAANSG